MDARRARDVTLLEAFETATPTSPSWSADDRAWADRVAREASADGDDLDAFVSKRAVHAMHRLGEREPQLVRLAAEPMPRGGALVVVLVVAFALGVAADTIGSNQRINLLAPPLWGVLLWNVIVYLLLLVTPLVRLARRSSSSAPGPILRFAQALAQRGLGPIRRAAKGGFEAPRRYASLWLARSRGLAMLRGETLLHAGAAAIGLGFIAGLYLRGLALDYRVVWESTLLDAHAAHALVSTVFAPASLLSGISLPDEAAFAAMRVAAGAGTVGAPAAPWLHLIALTLAIVVVVPRAVLALGCGAAAAWRSRSFPMPFGDPYFERLSRLRGGRDAHVVVVPYAASPSPQGALGLRAWLAEAFGGGVDLRLESIVAFGEEDAPLPTVAEATTHAIVLFDLSATPEDEHHGRFVSALAAALPAGAVIAVAVDAGAFARRFAGLDERVAQRREAWRRWGEGMGIVPIVVDLEHETAAVDALEAVFVSPRALTPSTGRRDP